MRMISLRSWRRPARSGRAGGDPARGSLYAARALACRYWSESEDAPAEGGENSASLPPQGKDGKRTGVDNAVSLSLPYILLVISLGHPVRSEPATNNSRVGLVNRKQISPLFQPSRPVACHFGIPKLYWNPVSLAKLRRSSPIRHWRLAFGSGPNPSELLTIISATNIPRFPRL